MDGHQGVELQPLGEDESWSAQDDSTMTVEAGEDRPLLDNGGGAGSGNNNSNTDLVYGSDNGRKSTDSSDEEAGSTEVIPRTIENSVLPEASHLGRHLSWHSAYILVISRVIGSGIFATPGAVVRSTGSIGLSLLVWTVGAVVAACGLAVSLEYGCMLPRSGGDKVYLEFTYRRPRFLASTMVAVQAVMLGFTASNCIVFSEYTLFALDVDASDLVRKALAAGLLTAITIVHGCLPRVGVAVQNVLGWIKVALIIFMVFVGLAVVIRQPTGGDAAGADRPPPGQFGWDELWKDSDWSWGTIATSLFKVFYSYAGLSNANNVLNDVKNPVWTLKTVSISALVTSLVLYTLINIAYFIVVPLDEIKQSGELIAALFFERSFGPNIGKRLLPCAIALSAGGNVMVVTYALARLNQEIARQGFLPFADFLASSRPFNAPMGGLLVHYIPSLLVITLPPSGEVYSFILDVEGYPGQFFALAISFGLVWLRFTRPDLNRPFKAWLPAVFLRIGLSLALIAAPFFPPRQQTGSFFYATYALVGVGIILFGLCYWYIWTRLIPRWKGYRLEEELDVLDEGVSITRLVKVPL